MNKVIIRFASTMYLLVFLALVLSSCGGEEDEGSGSNGLPEGASIEPITSTSDADFVVEGFVNVARNASNSTISGVITNQVVNGDSGTVTVNGTITRVDCSGSTYACTDYDGNVTYSFDNYRVSAKAPYLSYDVFVHGSVTYTWDRRNRYPGTSWDREGLSGSGLTIKMIPIETYVVGYEATNLQISITNSAGWLYLSNGTQFNVSL